MSPKRLVIGAALLLGLGVLASELLFVAGIVALFAAGPWSPVFALRDQTDGRLSVECT